MPNVMTDDAAVLGTLSDAERSAIDADTYVVAGQMTLGDEEPFVQIDYELLSDGIERAFATTTQCPLYYQHRDAPIGHVHESVVVDGEVKKTHAANETPTRIHGGDRVRLELVATLKNDTAMAREARVLAERDELVPYIVTHQSRFDVAPTVHFGVEGVDSTPPEVGDAVVEPLPDATLPSPDQS